MLLHLEVSGNEIKILVISNLLCKCMEVGLPHIRTVEHVSLAYAALGPNVHVDGRAMKITQYKKVKT